MSVIIDFFVAIIDIVVSLVKLIFTLLDSIIWLITNLPQLVAGVTAGFAYCPSFLMPFLLVSVSIMVVFCIIKML